MFECLFAFVCMQNESTLWLAGWRREDQIIHILCPGCAAVREEDVSTCQPTYPNTGTYLGPGQTKPGSTSPFNVGSFCVV